MERDLSLLSQREFDLVVIGGGIFGACAAWDATQRGLSVALIDRGDFCSATSANSFKMIHGGIRYLQHGNLRRVRQSSNARRALLRVAPHLARPLPIVVPTFGYGIKSKLIMRIAMGLYDTVTFDRNRGISDPRRRIPRGRCLSRREAIERFPGLSREGLTGAAVFCDGQLYNPPRLVLAYVQSAAEAGAFVANYVEAEQFLGTDDRVRGVEARDALNGEKLTIRGKVVLNAAGPYAEGLLEHSLSRPLQSPTHWSRDAFFVVAKSLVDKEHALALQAQTKDPDALLSRGERHLFLIPWRGYTLVGVWHKVYRGTPDGFTVTEQEIDTFLREINGAYTNLELTREDVALWNAGLIPFGENSPDAEDLKFGHHSQLIDHAKEQQVEGLITLIGVRFTTGPCEAVTAVDSVIRKLGITASQSRSHLTPLHGGQIDDFEALVEEAISQRPTSIDAVAVRALVHNYGSEYRRLFQHIEAKPHLGRCVGSSHVLEAEVVYAVRHEMAQKLADVVLRRTDLGTGEYPGREALETCAELMATEMGWDADRTQQEVDQVVESYPANIRQPSETGDVGAF